MRLPLLKTIFVGPVLLGILALGGCGGGGSSSPAASASSPSTQLADQATLTAVATPSTVTVGQTSALSTMGGSGTGAVIYSVVAGGCTVSGATLTAPASAGTCQFVATKAADSTYATATSAPVAVTVDAAPATQTITFSAPSTASVGGGNVTLSASASSGLPVSYASTTPSTCTVSGSTLTPVASGSCSITASQAGNSTYPAAKPVTVSFMINGQAQTITFPTVTAPAVGKTATLAATASSNLAVTYTASPASVCTVSGSTLTAVAAGGCTVTASQTGDAAYAAASSVPQTITISGGSVAQVVFSSGFTATGVTLDGGGTGGYSGSNLDGYNCTGGPSWCGGATSAGTSAATSSEYYYYQTPSPSSGQYVGIFVQAPGVTALSTSGNTSGVTLNGQTSMSFTFNTNPEWAAQTVNNKDNIMVELTMGNLYNGTCHIQLQTVITPTGGATPTTYTIPLTAFTVPQDCGTSATVAQALQQPIAQIDFQGDSGASALTAGNPPATSSANTTVLTTASPFVYPTTLALTGPITFQ